MAMTELERMALDIFHSQYGEQLLGALNLEFMMPAIMTALTKAPPGWKLVPEQLTEAMDVAAYLDEQNPNAGPSTIWRAFLAAAPKYKEVE